jgi:hypothetical protein
MEPSGSGVVSLPHLRSLAFEGTQEFLNSIKAQNLQNLSFRSVEWEVNLNLTQSMTQLSTMILESMNLGERTLSKPLYLPKLTSLMLDDVIVGGPLREFFDAAGLKRLYLDGGVEGAIASGEVVPTGERPSKRRAGPTTKRIPKLFSQGFPALEMLSVSRTPLDESFATDLQQFSQLRCLRIDYYAIEHFVPAFFRRVGDESYLPSLEVLQISCKYQAIGPVHCRIWSWPLGSRLPYEDFAECCVIKRPDLSIFRDGDEDRCVSYADEENWAGPFQLYQRRDLY